MVASAHGQRSPLAEVPAFLDAGQWAEAGEACHQELTRDPDDPDALYWLCRTLLDTDKPGIAIPVARQLTRIEPDRARSWTMLGAAEAFLQRWPQALKALAKAKKKAPDNPEVLRLHGTVSVMLHDFSGMHSARKSLGMQEHFQAHVALAFGHLLHGEWSKGWLHYRYQMGHAPGRDLQNYGLPEWAGEPGKVLVYAEQGLGDQLAYMSAQSPHQLVCHPKLAALFARTFREVHGDQFRQPVSWPVTSDYQTSMASAMRYLPMQRRGGYLKACPEKSAKYRKRLDALGPRKKIGIGWTGGKPGGFGWSSRNLTLEQLAPIFDVDADFISLEYRDTPCPDWIHDWPDATRTKHLDDLAALVDNLDAVVTVPTTAYHLAGALGKPAHVLIHKLPHFHEGLKGDSPWWETVTFYRRVEMGTQKAIEAVADAL